MRESVSTGKGVSTARGLIAKIHALVSPASAAPRRRRHPRLSPRPRPRRRSHRTPAQPRPHPQPVTAPPPPVGCGPGTCARATRRGRASAGAETSTAAHRGRAAAEVRAATAHRDPPEPPVLAPVWAPASAGNRVRDDPRRHACCGEGTHLRRVCPRDEGQRTCGRAAVAAGRRAAGPRARRAGRPARARARRRRTPGPAAQQLRRSEHRARASRTADRLDRFQRGRAVAHGDPPQGAAAQARARDRSADPASLRGREGLARRIRSARARPLFVDPAVLARARGNRERRRQHPAACSRI